MFQDYAAGASGPKFDPYSEASTLAERWRLWRRNFQYYIDSQVGLNDRQKVSRLLHQAGAEVQEIYENIKDEDVGSSGTDYEKCVKRLDLYFEPEVNINYERQKFRDLVKEENETIEQFVIKLRKQARYCEFSDKDEAIKDQLIEKCTDLHLKVKFLKKGRELTLNKAMEISRLYEMEKEVVADKSLNKDKVPEEGSINKVSNVECYRCGRRGHFAKSAECSATHEKCNKCGMKGHFAKCCKSKVPFVKQDKSKKKKRVVRYVVESCSEDSDDSESECENNKAILQRATYKVGLLTIQGVATCLYLCMDACGFHYAHKDLSDDCMFEENIEENNYNTYSRVRGGKKTYLALGNNGKSRRTQIALNRPLGNLSVYALTLTRRWDGPKQTQCALRRHRGKLKRPPPFRTEQRCQLRVQKQMLKQKRKHKKVPHPKKKQRHPKTRRKQDGTTSTTTTESYDESTMSTMSTTADVEFFRSQTAQ